MDLLKKAIGSLLSLPIMNPLVQSTAKHLSRITLTETSLRSTGALHPDIRQKVITLMDEMATLGKPVYIASAFRSAAEQESLYAQGRTTPGVIVTHAQALESAHNFGLAVDFMFTGFDYSYNQPPNDYWQTLGEVGEKHGLAWGGRWAGFVDRPHFEHPEYDASRKALKDFFNK
jgi:peptidoglycan L-alanyl-D-glutamate endopeptidase CwlK